MNLEKYDQLISKLEKSALASPQNYLQKVIFVTLLGFAVLGLALLMALLPIAALVGLVLLTIATGGKALLFLVKFGKLLILLLLPTWYMLKSSVKLLFTRFPKPHGIEINPEDCPVLASEISELRKKMPGPPIHHVLLTGDINAAIVQHPRLGLFGWEHNYLILGLPLLQVMSKDEAMAVIAHEYGHLSGHHSRFHGFIYRLRRTWGQLQDISESWNDWGSKLIARLFRWYAPYFNAYTFVYARQNEYLADRHSVSLVGTQPTANALVRTQIASQFEYDHFWTEINRIIINQAEPIQNKSDFWKGLVHEQLDETKRLSYLELASKRITDHHDTHPSLSDRLTAIGQHADESIAKNMLPPNKSAAEILLGDSLRLLSRQLDAEWKKNISEQWQTRHAYIQDRKQRLQEIQAKTPLTEQDEWDKICITEELEPDTAMLALINHFLTLHPDHLNARYRRALLLLKENDEQGIADLEFVMRNDAEAILACCEAAWRFYQNQDVEKAEHYRTRWIKRSDYLNDLHAETSTFAPDSKITSNDLDADSTNEVITLIKQNNLHIKKVYLLRRVLKTDENIKTYVLAFETKWLTFGDKSTEILNRLAKLEYPVAVHIVNLKHKSYKKLAKSINNLKLEPIYIN